MRSPYDVDELRETWCLLTLEAADDGTGLSAWELGDANISELIRVESHSDEDTPTPATLCEQLYRSLEARRDEARLLITPDRDSIGILRHALLTNNKVGQPTLRGFRHVGVANSIEERFVPDGDSRRVPAPGPTAIQKVDANTAVPDLWDVWTGVVPLLPAAVVHGERL